MFVPSECWKLLSRSSRRSETPAGIRRTMRAPRAPHTAAVRSVIAACAVAASAAACGGERAGTGASETGSHGLVIDDFGDTVRTGPAYRIVSLNPVTTEFLFTVGAGERVVGRTHWDHYPPAARTVPDLGNGIGPNVEVVVGARPDLVILYATTGNQRAAAALRAAGVRTLAIRTDRIADLGRFADAYARVTGDTATRHVVDTVMAAVEAVRRLPRPQVPARVFWRIGEPPLFTAGRGSFLGELIEAAGAINVFGDVEAPSPQVSLEEVVRRNPDLVIVGPAGAARVRESAAWQAIPAVRAGRIAIVDTALIARPGVRLGEAARHVRELIYGRPGSPP